MRCETSFFSLTLFAKHLKRYWPMWAVWLAGWTLAIPVELWNRANSWGNRSYADTYAQQLSELLGPTTGVLALVAPIVAVAVFFHLFKGPAANFVGALPLRREGVFATAFAAGYAMLTVPLMAVTLITMILEGALGVVALEPLFSWLGGSMLLAFFWFSFATLCCVISGNAVAGVSFYVIFNGVVATMTWLVQGVLQVFLYGFDQFGEGVWKAAMWLTPIYQTSLQGNALEQMVPGVSRFEILWAYAAVGFLMTLAALGLHHIRKSERAGDLIAFGPIRWVFRISVTLCGGLALGMLLVTILFWRVEDDMGVYLAACCAVAAVVSWFVAEMLLQKSFKVFKGHWKGALVGALCFVVAICAIDMDWIGFTTRVPAADQVKRATATFSGSVDPVALEGLVYDDQTVSDLIALHQYMVDHQDLSPEFASADVKYCHLVLSYDLGLTTLRRDYSVQFAKGGTLDQLLAAAQLAGAPDLDLDRGAPAEGYADVRGEDAEGWYCDLTPVQAEAAWAAVQADVEAGRYRADQPDSTWTSYLELVWVSKDGNRTHQTFYPRASATALSAYLTELELQVETEEPAEGEGGAPDDGLPATEVTPLDDGRVWINIGGQEVRVTPGVARELLDIALAENEMIVTPAAISR